MQVLGIIKTVNKHKPCTEMVIVSLKLEVEKCVH